MVEGKRIETGLGMFGEPARSVSMRSVSWQPLKGWGVSSGVYSFAMHGDRFTVGETEKLGSIDELLDLLRQGKP